MSIQNRAARAVWRAPATAVALAIVAYLPALAGEFVYDDRFQVLRNPTLTDWQNLPSLFTRSVWQFMSGSADVPIGLYYRPLFNAALLLQYQAFGTDTVGWHAVALALHGLVTLLVYRLGRAWNLPVAAAASGAVLFAVHPVHVESVAWISGLPDLLAATALLGAAVVYERARQTGLSAAWVAALLLFGVALLSKETALLFPLFVAAREWMDDASTSPGAASRPWRRCAPFAALAVAGLAARYAVLGQIAGTEVSARAVSGAQVLLTMPSVLATYLRLLFFPYPLNITYDLSFVTDPASARFLLPLVIVVPIVAAAGVLVAIAPLSVRPLLWTGIFLWPVLNLTSFNHYESLVHDRYLYIPSVGFCLLLGVAVAALRQRSAAWRRLATGGVVALVTIWLALTWMQTRVWHDDIALADHALRWHPESSFFHNFRGAARFERGDLAGAEDSYLTAIRLRPGYGDAYSNLGDAHLRAGRWLDAATSYRQALASGAAYQKIYLNLGYAQTQLGDRTGAEASYRAADQTSHHAPVR